MILKGRTCLLISSCFAILSELWECANGLYLAHWKRTRGLTKWSGEKEGESYVMHEVRFDGIGLMPVRLVPVPSGQAWSIYGVVRRKEVLRHQKTWMRWVIREKPKVNSRSRAFVVVKRIDGFLMCHWLIFFEILMGKLATRLVPWSRLLMGMCRLFLWAQTSC